MGGGHWTFRNWPCRHRSCFREDAGSRDVLSSMLLKLKNALEVVVAASSSSSEKIPHSNDDLGNPKQDDEPSTPSSSPESSIDQDTFSDMSHDDDHPTSSPFEHIEETITFLYRFLNAIKKADSKHDTAKVVAFKAKHAHAADDADFDKFIRWSIEREIPNSSAAFTKSHPRFPSLLNLLLEGIWDNIVDEIHCSKIASQNISGDKTWQSLRQYTAVTIISRWWRKNKSKANERYTDPIDDKTIAAAISIQPFPMLRNWLQDCVTNHSLCEAAVTPFTPTRLIYVKPESPCIVDGNSVPGCKCLALSFNWSSPDIPKLMNATIKSWKSAIAPSNLPQLWLDAINLTKALGLQYLWIDALCIIQDSVEDVKGEIISMRRIYDGATMIITAADAASVEDSLFAPSKASNVHFSEYSQFGKKHQDEILSVRLLSFEMPEIAWRCRTVERCEHGDSKDLTPENSKSTTTLLQDWRQVVVKEYTQRQPGFHSDRLLAIADVATSYARRIEGASGSEPTYVAGIWLEDLLPGLCWFNQRDYDHLGHRQRPAGPSWSWGAIDDPVDFSEITHFDAIEVTHYSVDFNTGMVESGNLTVKGYLLEVNINLQLSPHTWEPVFTSVSFRRDLDQQWRLKLPEKTEPQSLDAYVSTAVYENYNNARFDVNIDDVSEADLCFMPFGFDCNGNDPPIGFHGLLLRKLPDRTYERVGYVEQQRVPQNNPTKLRIMSSNFKLSELGEAIEIKIV